LKRVLVVLIAFACTALICTALLSRAAPDQAVLVRQLEFRDSRFTVVTADLRQVQLKLFWKNPKGQIFSSLKNVERHVKSNGLQLLAATNAGIFDTSQRPLGFHVERGQRLHDLKTRRRGYGNFYLQPNGVFYLDAKGAGILETMAFERAGLRVLEATQSGPLLVQNGRIHAAFQAGSPNRLPRNAIGVQSGQIVHLVISNDWVNFDDLARFMRDTLRCTDALYLDGSISKLRIPGDREDDGEFAGIIGLIR
jgi:uncharacterized protein YigE (DUF2233 family)